MGEKAIRTTVTIPAKDAVLVRRILERNKPLGPQITDLLIKMASQDDEMMPENWKMIPQMRADILEKLDSFKESIRFMGAENEKAGLNASRAVEKAAECLDEVIKQRRDLNDLGHRIENMENMINAIKKNQEDLTGFIKKVIEELTR
jgi:uncharacterized protein YllA (UPF0747 family)